MKGNKKYDGVWRLGTLEGKGILAEGERILELGVRRRRSDGEQRR